MSSWIQVGVPKQNQKGQTLQPEFSLCSGKQEAWGVLNGWGEGKG